MTISPTTTSTAASAATASTASTKSEDATDGSGIAADFETFLTLLTTQMRNQDPLKPMESTEFIAQLAAFSGVEQQVRANDRLDGILSALGGETSASLAAWIGREVRAPAKSAFDGDPVDVGFTPVDGADKAVLVVKNDFGSVVARRSLESGTTTAKWDGTDDVGNALPNGTYGFTVESYKGSDLVGTQTGSVYTTVTEVRLVDGTPTLVVGDGQQVALDDVTGLR